VADPRESLQILTASGGLAPSAGRQPGRQPLRPRQGGTTDSLGLQPLRRAWLCDDVTTVLVCGRSLS